MHYLAITSLIWAFSFGLIGNALKGIDPLQVADVRLMLALLVFLPFLKWQQTDRQEKWQLIAIGAIQYGVMYTCLLSSFRYLPSHLVALFTVLTPLYIVIIDSLRKRYFSIDYILAAALSVAGAAVIKAQNTEGADIWLGFALIQIANLAFAFGQVAYRDWKQARPELAHSAVFAWLYLGGALFTAFAAALISGKGPIPLEANAQQWAVLLYLGLVASGLGFFMWNKGATLTTTGILAAFNNAVVPLAMFASLFIFAEAKGGTVEELTRLGLGAVLIGFALLLGRRRAS
ncbi:EamA family transporter [uncultured Pseudoteredinibacter sp.]|uniref:EamA family transporter n=1 Tax=uncultured Pseudoteredinibacter sp. TaxID=1641701 RepID=UPI002612F3A6|nr:EamA family transporter [uncultured Pseudoteredinibacter sp.]